METYTQEVIVSGNGKEKSHAFSQALQNVQQKLMKQSSDVFLQIEPIDVEVLKAEQQETTERFLFFFLPRKKITYLVELKVKVVIKKISQEKINFIVKKEDEFSGSWRQFISKKVNLLFQIK